MCEATEEVSVTAIASVISELESISSLKEEQRTALKAFLDEKDVFALLPTGFGKSLIDRWFIQSPARFVLKVPALFQIVSNDGFSDGSV